MAARFWPSSTFLLFIAAVLCSVVSIIQLNALQWDGNRKCNTDKMYCYCAGPGL